MKRARILFTIPNLITAGSRLELLQLVSLLDRTRFEPALAVLKRGNRELEEEFRRMGVPILEVPFTVPLHPRATLLQRCWEVAQTMQRYRFDLWHSYHYNDDYSEAIIAKMTGAQWIYLKKNMSWNTRGWKLRSMLSARIIARNTSMLERFFDSFWFRDKTVYIPAGIDENRFAPGTPPRLKIKESLGIGPGELLTGCIANLEQVKGHPFLIEAAAAIPNMHLAFAGAPYEPAYIESLHQLAAERGMTERVHFLGRVSDIPALCAELDVFVLPTRATGRGEGFGVALIEAMGSGVPSIATAIDGPKDIIEHGVSGLLVPPEDTASLREALEDLASRPERRAELAAGARRRVLDRFTLQEEVRTTEMLYADILELRSQHAAA